MKESWIWLSKPRDNDDIDPNQLHVVMVDNSILLTLIEPITPWKSNFTDILELPGDKARELAETILKMLD